MTSDRFLVVGVKTFERELFALSSLDADLLDAGLEPSIGRSEADIDERFRSARKWMASVASRTTSEC